MNAPGPRVHYAMLTSVDGYVADADGGFEWAVPDAEVHQAVNDLARDAGAFWYGRRMFEVMAVWEDVATDRAPADTEPDPEPEPVAAVPAVAADWATLWRATDKVVWSASLDAASVRTSRTRLAPRLDRASAVAAKEAAAGDVFVSGPTLAAAVLAAGLLDEVHLFVHPVTVGGGLPALPRDRRVDLALTAARRFASGVVRLDYAVAAR